MTSYNVNEKIDPPLKEEKQLRPLYLAFLWISVVGSIFFYTAINQSHPGIIIIPGVSLILLLILGLAKMMFTGKYTAVTKSKVTGYNYTCSLCAYRWKWMIGTPLPETHVQPDLVMKGAEKLREEEEERRRRMD